MQLEFVLRVVKIQLISFTLTRNRPNAKIQPLKWVALAVVGTDYYRIHFLTSERINFWRFFPVPKWNTYAKDHEIEGHDLDVDIRTGSSGNNTKLLY
jgi:hypothetical protein